MMEVFLELASSVALTLLVFHIFGKLVTSNTFGANAKVGDGNFDFFRDCDSVTGKSAELVGEVGGERSPENVSGDIAETFDAEEVGEFPEIRDFSNGSEETIEIAQKLLDESSERDSEEYLGEKDDTEFEELIEVRDHDEEGEDWVGIERTELERLFGSAIAFFGSSSECHRLLTDDVKTKLYGLHKIATQGRCLNPKPMALKVSARAKWNAWQQLGEMTPEMAMEQYVSLLSKKIPKRMEYELKGDGKQVSVDDGNERKLEEIQPCD